MEQRMIRLATSWRLASCLGAAVALAMSMSEQAPADLITRPQAPTSDQPPPPVDENGIIAERRIGDRPVSFAATEAAAERLLKLQLPDGSWVSVNPEDGLSAGSVLLATAVSDAREDLDASITPGAAMASPNVHYGVRGVGVTALEHSILTSPMFDDASGLDAFPEVILAGPAPAVGSVIRVMIGGTLANPKYAEKSITLDAERIATGAVGASVAFGGQVMPIVAIGFDLTEFGVALDAPVIGLQISVPLAVTSLTDARVNGDGVAFAGRGPFQDAGGGGVFAARFISGSNPTFASVGEGAGFEFSEISFASTATRSRQARSEAPLNQSSQPNTNPLRPRPQFPPIITIDPEPPDDPDDPDDPDEPTDPENPEDPTDPDGPDWPDGPDPEDPDNPNPNPPDDDPDGGPDWPDNPDGPDGPDGPDVPDVPAPGAIVLMFGGSLLNSRRRR